MISVGEALGMITQEAVIFRERLGKKSVNLIELSGYVLGKNIYADRDYPPFHRALMDGYALCASDYKEFSGKGFFLLENEIWAGDEVTSSVRTRHCVHIATGASLPSGTDAVVPVEEVKELQEIQEGQEIEARKAIYFSCNSVEVGYNVAHQGEDVQKGTELLARGTVIQSSDIATLASVGAFSPVVFSPPRCAIISTGNELLPMEKTNGINKGSSLFPKKEQIRDANFPCLASYLLSYHVPILFHQVVIDNPNDIQQALREALQYDLVLITGGVSMGGGRGDRGEEGDKGNRDFIPQALHDEGVECLFHRVNIKPGKPLWFGRKEGGSVVFALPGNNFSVQVNYKIFVEAFLRASMEASSPKNFLLPLERKRERSLRNQRPEYFPCIINHKGRLEYYAPRSSGDVRSALFSHGIALHPVDTPNLPADSLVEFWPW